MALLNIMVWMIMLIAVGSVSAQSHSGGFGGFMAGGTSIQNGKLNDRLAASAYATFPNEFITWGGGGYAVINNFLFGGEGHTLVSRRSYTSAFSQALSGSYGFFDVGQLVWVRKGFRLYYVAGVGGGGVRMRLSERTEPDFANVLTTPQREIRLQSGGWLLHAAVALDRWLFRSSDRGGTGGLFAGIRVGYTWSPLKNDWKWSGGTIPNAPDIRMTGPYVRLMFGGGGMK